MIDERVHFAQKALIVNQNCLLMIRKTQSHPFHPGKWDVPGGRLGMGEELAEGLEREVFEEVGLDVRAAEPLALWLWRFGQENSISTIVVALRACLLLSSPEGARVTDAAKRESIASLKWVPLDQVDKYETTVEARQPLLEAIARRFA